MRVIVFVIAVGVLTFASSAAACSCRKNTESSPAPGAHVPRNARIWLPWRRVQGWLAREHLTPEDVASSVLLLGPASKELIFQVIKLEIGVDFYFVLIPRDELEPGPHLLKRREPFTVDDEKRAGVSDVPFIVTDSRLEQPPSIPRVVLREWKRDDAGGMCSFGTAAILRVEHSGWLLAYQIYAPEKTPAPESVRYDASRDASFWIAGDSCSPFWDFGAGPALVRFGTVDLAGKFSGWGEPIRLDPPWGPKRPERRRPTFSGLRSNLTAVADAAQQRPRARTGGSLYCCYSR